MGKFTEGSWVTRELSSAAERGKMQLNIPKNGEGKPVTITLPPGRYWVNVRTPGTTTIIKED